MAKYRAKEDVPPTIKKGDVVELKEPLVGSFASRFEPYNGDSEGQTSETAGDNDSNALKTGIVNPSRDELKAKAKELGINFASNIPTDRLIELLQEAEAKRQVGDGSEGTGGGGGDGDKSDDEGGEGGGDDDPKDEE